MEKATNHATAVRGSFKRAWHSESGSAMLGLLLVTTTLLLLGAPMLTTPLQSNRLLGRISSNVNTLAMAETGVERALWEFNHNNAAFDPSIWSNCELAGYATCNMQTLSVDGHSVLVTVYNEQLSDPTVVATSQDESGVGTRVTVQLEKPEASPFQHAALSTFISDQIPGMTISGGSGVDSYNSNLGVYALELSPWDSIYGSENHSRVGFPETYRASIGAYSSTPYDPTAGTFMTEQGEVTTGGAAILLHPYGTGIFAGLAPQVFGSAFTAAGGAAYDASYILGSTGTIDIASLPEVELPADPSGCTDLGDVVINGTSETHTESCYTANSITLDQGGSVAFPNATEIKVAGNLAVLNGSAFQTHSGVVRAQSIDIEGEADINNDVDFEALGGKLDVYTSSFIAGQDAIVKGVDSKPANLRVYIESGGSAGLAGGATVYGALYLQGSGVVMLGGVGPKGEPAQLYGAVVAPFIYVSDGGQIHFDEALKDEAIGWPVWLTQPMQIESWVKETF